MVVRFIHRDSKESIDLDLEFGLVGDKAQVSGPSFMMLYAQLGKWGPEPGDCAIDIEAGSITLRDCRLSHMGGFIEFDYMTRE